ncbi:MAG: hypothetical protein GY832_35645 [Chloroflexi bacterium]|nr:hypothetical protein [Chloroflexota bacterium]
MAKKRIPDEIRAQVDTIVEQFNKKELRGRNSFYTPRYRGNYLYLDRNNWGRVAHVCRLKYNGAMDNWDFAIYKYSDERYDPDEWMFPGGEHIDGTIEGAMRAGMGAYPV